MIEQVTAVLAALSTIVFISVYATVKFESSFLGINIMLVAFSQLLLSVGITLGFSSLTIAGWLAVAVSMVHRTHLLVQTKKVQKSDPLSEELSDG